MTAEELASIILEHLRAIRATQDDHTERFARLESRMNSLELVVAGMRRDLSHRYGDIVEQPASNASNDARTSPTPPIEIPPFGGY